MKTWGRQPWLTQLGWQSKPKELALTSFANSAIPIKPLLHGTVHEEVLSEPAADIDVRPTFIIRQMITQRTVIERWELNNPQTITGIVEEAPIFAYQ